MFNQRIFNDQENFEEPNFNTADFPPSLFSSLPLDPFGPDFFPREDQLSYMPQGDFEGFEQGLPFLIDPIMYQSFQEDIKRFIPSFDLLNGFGTTDLRSPPIISKGINSYVPGRKIGTISAEERRLKVQRFLEKRKRRVFKKRISYACRKRVADSRVRVKGRFVTKEQASVLSGESEITKGKEEGI